MPEVPERWRWFAEGRYGLFIHWGPYSMWGRGEQVLLRERLDQADYERQSCLWNPERYDPREWARVAKRAGMRYAVLTSRHHDGYCLWDSRLTDYTSAAQAPGRDFVREYVEAFRAEGLRVGLYYSFMDARIPAFWEGPAGLPEEWEAFREYIHGQVRELLTGYGKIDVFWFDGAWPRSQSELQSRELVEMMRRLQPDILINNRLGHAETAAAGDEEAVEDAGLAAELGDFGTPEHRIVAEDRLWESCQVSTQRLWGYTIGERWRNTDHLLSFLVEAAVKGGNLLLNVGPKPDGTFPPEFVERVTAIGEWLKVHGEAIYGRGSGDVTEFVTYGWQTVRGNNLYLIIRFWDGRDTLTMPGLKSQVQRAVLLTTGQELEVNQSHDYLTLRGLPARPPTDLFPVIRLECDGEPEAWDWAKDRLWKYDPRINTEWAAARGRTVWVGK